MITRERLHQVLSYDPETGGFTWRASGSGRRPDLRAGTITSQGYLGIQVDRRLYLAHRLAFLWMTGAFPSHDVDHRDMDRLNNRWPNLREATRAQNMMNGRARSNNATGFKGVTFLKPLGRYQARIRVSGEQRYLGLFDTQEEAHAAYRAAAEKHFGEFARF